MKVQMKYQITGLRNGEPWPEPGTQIDLPDDEGAMVIASGMAEAAQEPEPETVKGVKPEPETAEAKSDAETR
jgi:hypothetical protein